MASCLRTIGRSVNEEALVSDAKLEDRILLELKTAYHKPLLNKHKKLIEADEEGKTPLMWAVIYGNYIAVQWLLEEIKKNGLISHLTTRCKLILSALDYAVCYQDLENRMSLRRRILDDVCAAFSSLGLSRERVQQTLCQAIPHANKDNNLYFLKNFPSACDAYIKARGITELIRDVFDIRTTSTMDFSVLSFWANNSYKYNIINYGYPSNLIDFFSYFYKRGDAYFKLVYTTLLNDPVKPLSRIDMADMGKIAPFLLTHLDEDDILKTLALQSQKNHLDFLLCVVNKNISLTLLEKMVAGLFTKPKSDYSYILVEDLFSIVAFKGFLPIVKELLRLQPQFKFDKRINLPKLPNGYQSIEHVQSDRISNIICFLHHIKEADKPNARLFAAKIPLEDRGNLVEYFNDNINKVIAKQILAETSVLNEVQVEGERINQFGLFAPQPGSPRASAHFQHLVGFFNLAKKQLEEFAQVNPNFDSQVREVLRGSVVEANQIEFEQEGKESRLG